MHRRTDGRLLVSCGCRCLRQMRQRSKIEEIMVEMGWNEEKMKMNGVDEDAFVEMTSKFQRL